MNDKDLNFSEHGNRISLEIGTPIQLTMPGVAFPMQSDLVGMKIDEYLILKVPGQYPNIKHKFYPGAEIIVRYIFNGIVYGFQTKLIEVITKPVNLIFMEYPKTTEYHDLRSHKRAQSIFPTTIKIKDETNKGVIIDISNKGCRCHLIPSQKDPLPSAQVDDEITLTCKFPGIPGDHVIQGIVRNVKKTRKELIIGIEFLKLEEELKNHISEYICDIEDFAELPIK